MSQKSRSSTLHPTQLTPAGVRQLQEVVTTIVLDRRLEAQVVDGRILVQCGVFEDNGEYHGSGFKYLTAAEARHFASALASLADQLTSQDSLRVIGDSGPEVRSGERLDARAS